MSEVQPRDRLKAWPAAATPAADQPLYAERQKVYPKAVRGPVRRAKWAILALCLGLYYLVPWLRWDRGPGVPDQAVLVDIANACLFFFWIELWPQEIYFLAGALILGAIALFAVSSLFGRVWCGFTRPQTVWTGLFMWVERLIEGDRVERMRLDKAPWTAAKWGRKAAKHAAWLAIAAATGGAWIMYFNDAPTVTREILTGAAGVQVYFYFGLFTATTYVLAGWAREQVCICMCPWPRFQAAMLDENSLVVTYRGWRGKPREGEGPRRGRLRGLLRLRPRLPHRHRHPRRAPDRVHRLRPVHRRLRPDHGPARSAQGSHRLRDPDQPRGGRGGGGAARAGP